MGDKIDPEKRRKQHYQIEKALTVSVVKADCLKCYGILCNII